jgi:hypothetical protein
MNRFRYAVLTLGYAVLSCALVIVIGSLLLAAMDQPLVYKRIVSNDCAYVEVSEADRAEQYSCDKMPGRYDVVYVPEKWLPPGE